MLAIDNNMSTPSRCPQCRAEYRNIQHPAKPLGVIVQRLCDCKPVTTVHRIGEGATIAVTTLVPPPVEEGRP